MMQDENNAHTTSDGKGVETITLGAGCFWCVEAVFRRLNGVVEVQSGYSGGHTDQPSYKEVCSGTTGHAEVVQVIFHPDVVSVQQVLEVFFSTHDPTTLNRQGADVGTQYRSAIFYHNDHQREVAAKAIQAANESGEFASPIVTEITPFIKFFPAENYHNDYFELHGEQPYCRIVIAPKLEKFKSKFRHLLTVQ
jgi:peptide-methionine (S)-S-oxide reductase